MPKINPKDINLKREFKVGDIVRYVNHIEELDSPDFIKIGHTAEIVMNIHCDDEVGGVLYEVITIDNHIDNLYEKEIEHA